MLPPDSTTRWDLTLAKVVVKIVERQGGISHHRTEQLGQLLTVEGMTIPQDLKVEDIITAKKVLDIIERGAAAQAEEAVAHTREAVALVIKEKETVKEAILVATGGEILDLQPKRVCFKNKNSSLDIPSNRKNNILQKGITKNLGIKAHTK